MMVKYLAVHIKVNSTQYDWAVMPQYILWVTANCVPAT